MVLRLDMHHHEIPLYLRLNTAPFAVYLHLNISQIRNNNIIEFQEETLRNAVR